MQCFISLILMFLRWWQDKAMTKWRSFGRGIQKEPVRSRFNKFILEHLELYKCWDRNPAQRALRAFGIPSCSLRFLLLSQMSHVDGFTGIIVICHLFLIFVYHEINNNLNLWLWSYTELIFLKVHNNCCAFEVHSLSFRWFDGINTTYFLNC